MNRVARVFKTANPKRLATYLIALWKLARHRDTPRGAKWLALFVVAYALSPIDLIPDFIPVIGMLDDIVLVPLGVALVVRMTPKPLWQAILAEAEVSSQKLPKSWIGAALIVALWVIALALVAWAVVALFNV